MKANIKVNANCGCGFHITTEDKASSGVNYVLVEARKHAVQTGHKMDLFGRVIPEPDAN